MTLFQGSGPSPSGLTARHVPMFTLLRSPEIPSIHPLLRNNPSHPAPRVLDIPPVPGDQVDVQVHHRLPGCLPDIHADVVAVWPELPVEVGLRLPDQGEQRLLLLPGGVEEVGEMPERDDQQVARVHRVAVVPGIAEVVFEDDL